MGSFEVAHIRQQGVDLIIVPVDDAFGRKSNRDQNEIQASLQACAAAAGLRGRVVPVWDAGSGRMGFLAPSAWAAFFKSIGWAFIARNINRKLTCR